MAGEEGSAFTGEGFKPFPNTYEDNKHIGEVFEWSDERLQNKHAEYSEFLERDDIMARARTLGARVLRHLDFEMSFRYDATAMQRLEDESCGTA